MARKSFHALQCVRLAFNKYRINFTASFYRRSQFEWGLGAAIPFLMMKWILFLSFSLLQQWVWSFHYDPRTWLCGEAADLAVVILKHIVKSQNIDHRLQCRFDEGKLTRNFSATVFVVIGVAVARLSHFTQSIIIDYQFLCVPNVSIIVFYLSI